MAELTQMNTGPVQSSHPSTVPKSDLTISSYGDSALLVESRSSDPAEKWSTAHSLASSLRAKSLPGIESIVATFSNVMIEFDCVRLDPDTLRGWLIEHVHDDCIPLTSGRIITIPVHYGDEFGPDLKSTAQLLNLNATELIEVHSSVRWRVAFLGAPAGAPLHEAQAFDHPIARMPEPRTRIPAGTIAVSGQQGTIYTINAPGGWRLLGRTPLRIVNNQSGPFTAIRPGDLIKYQPISRREYEETPQSFIGEVL
jgi:KipI family sensor histidine kinase inhibitor